MPLRECPLSPPAAVGGKIGPSVSNDRPPCSAQEGRPEWPAAEIRDRRPCGQSHSKTMGRHGRSHAGERPSRRKERNHDRRSSAEGPVFFGSGWTPCCSTQPPAFYFIDTGNKSPFSGRWSRPNATSRTLAVNVRRPRGSAPKRRFPLHEQPRGKGRFINSSFPAPRINVGTKLIPLR